MPLHELILLVVFIFITGYLYKKQVYTDSNQLFMVYVGGVILCDRIVHLFL